MKIIMVKLALLIIQQTISNSAIQNYHPACEQIENKVITLNTG